MKMYAGIGSRNTPENILKVMTRLAQALDFEGYTLRSGDAIGGDRAFQKGTKRMEIWHPQKDNIPLSGPAWELAATVCDEFPLARMKPYIQQLIVRNMFQVLGEDLTAPVDFVVCWTPTFDPCDKDGGGTRYACRIAKKRGIQILNLRDPAVLAAVLHRIEEIEKKKEPEVLTKNIPAFKGEYLWLSNMAIAPFTDPTGLKWKSSEQYYQAGKFMKGSPRWEQVRFATNPYDAKKIGLSGKWTSEEAKIQRMREALKMKFTQNPELGKKLVDTGNKILQELNYWNDTFWGICNGKGENMLGVLLMELREELKKG